MRAFVRKNLVCYSLEQKVFTHGSKLFAQALWLVSINEGLSFQPTTHIVNRCKRDSPLYRIDNNSESHFLPFLPPANEVCECYIFTGVRLSTGGLCRGVSVWGGLCPGFWHEGLCPEEVSVRGEGLCPGGSLSGRSPRTVTSWWYTSYWNAFLSNDVILVPLNFLLEFNFSSLGIFIWMQLEKISSSVIS